LLESYLQDVDEILGSYVLSLQHIEAAEGRITMQLDMARNKLLTTSKKGMEEEEEEEEGAENNQYCSHARDDND